jgi:hypothetical protein
VAPVGLAAGSSRAQKIARKPINMPSHPATPAATMKL